MPSSILRLNGQVFRAEFTATREGRAWRVTGDLLVFRDDELVRLRSFTVRTDPYGNFQVGYGGVRHTFKYEEV